MFVRDRKRDGFTLGVYQRKKTDIFNKPLNRLSKGLRAELKQIRFAKGGHYVI
jgi:hypothetical protein